MIRLNITSYSTQRRIFLLLCYFLSGILLPTEVLSQAIPDSLLSAIPEPKDPIAQVDFLNDLAWEMKSSEPIKALEYADLAFQISIKENYKAGLGNAYHTKGMIKWYISEYEDASKFFFEGLKIREAINDSIGLARSYNNIGNVFFRQNNDSLALVYYQKALDFRKHLKDSVGLIYSYNNVGDVLARKDHQQGALKSYAKSLEIAEAINNQKGQAFVSRNLGKFYQNRKRYNNALDYYNKALQITEQLNNPYETAVNLNYVAEVYLSLNKPKKAITILERSIELSASIEGRSTLALATANISKAYAQQKDYKKAYEYQLAQQEVASTILNKSKDKAILEIQAKYNLVNQERIREKEMQQKERELNSMTNFVLIFSLIAIAVLFFLSLSRYVFQTKMNKLLQEKNRRIENQNKTLIQTNTSLEQFAYIASHDLKEPLRTIGSYSSLIKREYEGKLDEEADEYLSFIVKGVKQMYSLLEDVLAYARTDNEANMRKENVSMDKVLSSVKESLQKIVAQKNVEIYADPLPKIWANPFQMHQVLQNLISNGIKFNEADPIKIKLSVKKEKNRFIFSVKDNGIGIQPKYQEKIFNLFHRLDNRKYSGTGLGLAICAKIIANHDGDIWVKSDIGKGSTFYFSVGQREAESDTITPLPSYEFSLTK